MQLEVLGPLVGMEAAHHSEPPGHSLVPPAVIPETRKRWENRKISSTGATLTTVARASVGRSIVVDAVSYTHLV